MTLPRFAVAGRAMRVPPVALLISAVLFWLSVVMAFGEWWLDRRGPDSVRAEMAVPVRS